VSKGLVKHWRRLAKSFEQGGVSQDIRGMSEGADCRARADVYRQCADSLELSIRRAERKEKPNA
jgi:hypothetical protein